MLMELSMMKPNIVQGIHMRYTILKLLIVTIGVSMCVTIWYNGSRIQCSNVIIGEDIHDSSAETDAVDLAFGTDAIDLRFETETQCRDTFEHSLDGNIHAIEHYPKGTADKYLSKIGGNLSDPVSTREFPVIVTAFNSMFYPVAMGLFHSIHMQLMTNPHYNVKIVVYDLGLTSKQLKMLRSRCRCEIRPFPFDQFPLHVRDLMTYAFKPIIIQMSLMEFGCIWWADASVRFIKYDIDNAIQYVHKHGLLFSVQADDENTLSITKQTDVLTFNFLNEDLCKFRPYSEASATSVVLHFNNLSRVLVKAWATCALNRDCIAPVGTRWKLHCNLTDTRDGRCHRFDQSVFSILSRRIYHDNNKFAAGDILDNVIDIRRTEIVEYFQKCAPLIKCLA